MLTFYPVEIDQELDRANPLFVGNFFALTGMWWRKRKQRQGLIISIALAWYRLTKKHKNAPGFLQEETFITGLTQQVKDAKVILEHFFTITRIGFNFGEESKSPTLISPKKLNKKMVKAIEAILNDVKFEPGNPPLSDRYTQSQVIVRKENAPFIFGELAKLGREELIPPVTWLLNHENPITFYFEPAGNLQARDKSVWPIKSVELWPGWLRKQLFGTVIDLENAYLQFIMQSLEEKYKNKPQNLEMKYPDLVRADKNKNQFREDICVNVLKLPLEDDNISVVKRLIMSLANGSTISPLTLTNGSGRTDAVRLIHSSCPHLSAGDLKYAGERLGSITKQFMRAKRALCIHLLGEKPSRANQRRIFQLYFEWERKARYAIWETIGKTGLMLHDGIDGIVSDKSEDELVALILKQTSLRVSVDKLCEA